MYEDRTYGGGIYYNGAVAEIRNCIFKENNADVGGGVYFFSFGESRIVDCEFIGNNSKNGGGLFLETNSYIPD